MQEKTQKTETGKPLEDIIALRKSCGAEGTGLSHYILMDKKPVGEDSP